MHAFLPESWSAVGGVAMLLFATILGGFALQRSRARRVARPAAWLLLAGGLLVVERITSSEPAGVRMLALVLEGLFAMKGVVAVEAIAQGSTRPLAPREWLGFAAGWVGMRPAAFAGRRSAGGESAMALGAKGISGLLGGALLVGVSRIVADATGSRLAATVLLLPGLSLIFHFGLLRLLAAAWRAAGVDCGPLFRAPLRSRTLGEFWGRRWNIAFSEMTAVAIYRPLARRAGSTAAILASFLFSGALHEVAISLPVGAGFGGPLLYFALQGAAVLAERRLERTSRPVRGWMARAWNVFCLLAPLPLLFHVPFLEGVVWPLGGIVP